MHITLVRVYYPSQWRTYRAFLFRWTGLAAVLGLFNVFLPAVRTVEVRVPFTPSADGTEQVAEYDGVRFISRPDNQTLSSVTIDTNTSGTMLGYEVKVHQTKSSDQALEDLLEEWNYRRRC